MSFVFGARCTAEHQGTVFGVPQNTSLGPFLFHFSVNGRVSAYILIIMFRLLISGICKRNYNLQKSISKN